jgi:hypothetical protein
MAELLVNQPGRVLNCGDSSPHNTLRKQEGLQLAEASFRDSMAQSYPPVINHGNVKSTISDDYLIKSSIWLVGINAPLQQHHPATCSTCWLIQANNWLHPTTVVVGSHHKFLQHPT